MSRSLGVAARISLLAVGAATLIATASAPSSETRTIPSGGRSRTYRLHVPAALPRNRPVPLVLVFHGGEGDGASAERLTGFDAVADRQGFLVAYPDGVGKHWNDGRNVPSFETYRERVDDVAFVSGVIDAVSSDFKVDSARVFATGISNGAIFSNFLGARLSSRIAAIASVAGGLAEPLQADFGPAEPVSVLLFHGTEDPLVPYGGGGVSRDHGRVLGAQETARLWARADACSPAASHDAPPGATPTDSCRIARDRWTGGRNHTEVVLYTLDGGGHTWPGGPQYAPRLVIGRVCRIPDATRVIWDFFRTHPRA